MRLISRGVAEAYQEVGVLRERCDVLERQPGSPRSVPGDDQARDLDDLSIPARRAPCVASGADEVCVGGVGVTVVGGHHGEQGMGDRISRHGGSVR